MLKHFNLFLTSAGQGNTKLKLTKQNSSRIREERLRAQQLLLGCRLQWVLQHTLRRTSAAHMEDIGEGADQNRGVGGDMDWPGVSLPAAKSIRGVWVNSRVIHSAYGLPRRDVTLYDA